MKFSSSFDPITLGNFRIRFVRQRFDPTLETNKQTNFMTRTNFNPMHYLNPEGPDNVIVANYVPPNTQAHISLSTAWSCCPTLQICIRFVRHWFDPTLETNKQTDFRIRTNFNPLHYLKPEGPDNVTVANYVPPNTEGHISLSTAWSCWPTGGHISLRPPTFLSS